MNRHVLLYVSWTNQRKVKVAEKGTGTETETGMRRGMGMGTIQNLAQPFLGTPSLL